MWNVKPWPNSGDYFYWFYVGHLVPAFILQGTEQRGWKAQAKYCTQFTSWVSAWFW